MTRRITRLLGVTATALALGVGVSAPRAGAAAPAQSSGTVKIDVGDNFYKPVSTEITTGTKVTWRNTGKILHNVKPVKGKWGTGSLTRGKSYSYTFKKPGKYVYYCTFHGSPNGGQRGTITVVPAPPPTTLPPPTAPAG
jgi:plastocyanin